MSEVSTISAAFLLGFFGTLHCIGMCGGIIGALSLGLPEEIQHSKIKRFSFVLTYNLGRIFSYTLAGLIAGAISQNFLQSIGFQPSGGIAKIIGVSMMAAIGLYLTGWLPQLALVEKIGIPLWQRIEPFARKLMPIYTLKKAFFYGTIWGWLPCGMVYFALIMALTSSDSIQGGLTMLAFGLGTLPTLLGAGFFSSTLSRFARSTQSRQIIGVLIIVIAIATLFIPMGGQGHHHNMKANEMNQHNMNNHKK